MAVYDMESVYDAGSTHPEGMYYVVGVVGIVIGRTQIAAEGGDVGSVVSLRASGFRTIKAAVEFQVAVDVESHISGICRTTVSARITRGQVSAFGHPYLGIAAIAGQIDGILQVGIGVGPGGTVIGARCGIDVDVEDAGGGAALPHQ